MQPAFIGKNGRWSPERSCRANDGIHMRRRPLGATLDGAGKDTAPHAQPASGRAEHAVELSD